MKARNEIYRTARYADVYGMKVMKDLLLENGFTFCAWCQNSIPSEGTSGRKTKLLIPEGIEVERAIIHRKSHSITLKTNQGFLRFWRNF